MMQGAASTEYSDAGKKNLEILEDAVFYNSYIERFLLRFIAPGKAAVDFGAGGGEFAGRLSRAGIDVTCVELDPDLQKVIKGKGLKVSSDISGCRDCARVYSLNVLEHIEDDAAALKSIYDAMAPGGRLLLYVPAFMQIYTEVDRQVGHYRRYTMPELMGKLETAGFAVDEARYVDSLGFFAWALLKWLGHTDGVVSRKSIVFYDRVCFPVSVVGDFILRRWIGKNLLVIAGKPEK